MVTLQKDDFVIQADEVALRIRWHRAWHRVVANPNGVTGWATLVDCYPPQKAPVALQTPLRVHLCKHSPCQAMFPDNKYTMFGPPMHGRLLTTRPPADLADCANAPRQKECAISPAPTGSAPSHGSGGEVPPTPGCGAETKANSEVYVGPSKVPLPVGLPPAPSPTPLGLPAASAPLPLGLPPAPVIKLHAPADTDGSSATVVDAMIAFARAIARPSRYAGQFAFLLFGIMKHLRMYMWEGEARVDLIAVYAPWAATQCPASARAGADAIAAQARHDEGANQLVCRPIDDQTPLETVNHFVGGLPHIRGRGAGEDNGIEAFYHRLGVVVVKTVADGDCAIDVMCLAGGMQRAVANRQRLRLELASFLIDHVADARFQEAFCLCGELPEGDGDEGTHGGWSVGSGPQQGTHGGGDGVSGPQGPLPGTRDGEEDAPFSEQTLAAVARSCRLVNPARDMLVRICRALPQWCLAEQVAQYRRRPAGRTPEQGIRGGGAAPARSRVSARNTTPRLSVRRKDAEVFIAFSKRLGVDLAKRWPCGHFPRFLLHHLPNKKANRNLYQYYQRVVRTYMKHGAEPTISLTRGCGGARFVRYADRRRAEGLQGRPKKAPLVRQLLFEWFSVLRHSIKGRIPSKVVEMKAKQLLEDYCKTSLLQGFTPVAPKITSHWLRFWRFEYDVSFRKPNRKFKVPKAVLLERLKIFWSNVIRVRALCQLAHGIDPEMDGFDQTPYHKNEQGSQGAGTLAIRGAPIVPLLEGHAATRERWSANTMVTSSLERAQEIPPLECMFKADGENLERKLQADIRNIHGDGVPWLSVVTGPKASYREVHILNYLDRHLEPWGPGRQWRILFCDCFAPHMTDNVRRLAWLKGYILIIHGGGSTGVTQVNDTDLHQHLRRDYTEQESEAIIEEQRIGTSCPTTRPADCLRWMVNCWSNSALHVRAVKGFKYTGAANSLNGAEDHLICREAKVFWDELDMGAVRQELLHDVTLEYRAGRLRSNYDDVRALVVDFPKRGHLDVIQEFQDDEDVLDGGPPWRDDDDEEECEAEARQAYAVAQEAQDHVN